MKRLITIMLTLVCCLSLAAFASCTKETESVDLGESGHEHVWAVTAAEVAATCTTDGKTAIERCSVCGETKGGETVSALGHDIVHHDAKAATCTEVGWNAYDTCTRCDYSTYEEIAALGHDIVHHDAKAATCTEVGWNAYDTCTRCDYTTYEEIAVIEHDYESVVTAPTCTAAGYTTYTCSVCGDKYVSDETAVLGHNYEETTAAVAATCMQAGSTAVETCTRCNATKGGDEIKALGHNLSQEVIAPTCVADGYIKHSCSRCDYEYSEKNADATGVHTWDKDKSCTEDRECTVCGTVEKAEGHNYIETVFNATCATDGYTLHKCSVCGDEYRSDETEKLGHTPTGAWAESGKALKAGETCVYVTTYTATCSNCQQTIYKNEETVEHTSITVITVAAKCNVKGYKQEKCSVCGTALKDAVEYQDENAHAWDEGVFNSETGITTYTCAYCDGTKTVVTAEGTSATVSKDALSGNGVELKGSNVTIAMDSDTVEGLHVDQVELSAETLDEEQVNDLKLSDEQKERIGDKPIYNFTANGGEATNFDGIVTVTVPYELGENEDVDSIVVWYINNEGEIEEIAATYTNGYATFETSHFSYYTVTKMTPAERCEKYGHSDNVIVVAPTCTEGGYTLTVCMRCGRIERTAETAALGHSYILASERTATCTTVGYNRYECENCHRTYSVNLPAIGHKFEKTGHKDATCTELGYDEFECENCHATYKTTIAKLAHRYELEEQAPTCVESGYKKYTCVTCGDYYIIDIAPTGIHTYDGGVCTVCGREEPTAQETEAGFFTTGLISLLEKDEFTIAIPDLTIGGIPAGYDATGVVIVDEFYLSISKNGISGFGKVEFFDDAFPASINGGGWVYVKDGKVYVAYNGTTYSGSSNSDGQIDRVYTTTDGYAVLPLEEAFVLMTSNTGMKISIPVDEIAPMLPAITEWADGELIPLIKAALIAGDDVIEKYVGGLVNALFTVEEVDGNFVYTLSGEKAAAVIDGLYTKPLAENIDDIFGEGAYAEITEAIASLFDMTVGDLVEAIDNSAVTIDDIIAAADVLVNKLTGMDGVDALLSAMSGQEISVKAYIYNEEIADMRVVDIVTMIVMGGNGESSLPDKEYVLQMLQSMGETIIIPENVRPDAAYIAEIVEHAFDLLVISVTADNSGAILYADIVFGATEEQLEIFGGLIPQEAINVLAESDFTISIGRVIEPEFDYESAMAEYAGIAESCALTKDVLLALGVKEEDIVTDGNGNVVSVRVETATDSRPLDEKEFSMYVEKLMYSDGEFKAFYQQVEETFGSGENMKTTFEMREVTEDEYTVRSGVVITLDCGSWLLVRPNVNGASHVRRVIFISVENDAGEKLEGEFPLNDYYSSYGQFAFSYYYNTATGEVEFYNNNGGSMYGRHEFVEDASRFVAAVGCDGVGERHFFCKYCGEEVVEYFTNGHREVVETYEFASDDHDCENGVIVTRTCEVCGKVVSRYESKYHSTEYTEIPLETLGMCGGYIREDKCVRCGKVTYSNINDWECSWTYVTTSEDGTVMYFCQKCNTYKYVFNSESDKDENCRVEIVERKRYVKDNKEIYSYSRTSYTTRHAYEFGGYEMKGKTCYDGVSYYYVCKDCGYRWERYTSDHDVNGPNGRDYPIVKSSIDLADYGSVCGGTFEVVTCPCGEVETYRIDCDCHLDRKRIPLWIENAYTNNYGYDAYEYRCSVTEPQCNFVYRYACYYVKAENECMAYEYKIIEVFDNDNGTWVTLWHKPTGYQNVAHNYETSYRSYEEDGLRVNESREECPICGSYRTYKYFYDDENREVKYENANFEAQSNHLWSATREYFYENGYQYSSYYRYTDTRDDYEYWYKNEYEYDFAAGCVRTVIYTNSDGRYDTYTENCHKYAWNVIKEPTCTQYGEEGEYCMVCGQTLNTNKTEPICHEWIYIGDGYVCAICGLENSNGASGDVVMEDLTEEYGYGEYYVAGVYQRKEGLKYMQTVSIVPHVAPENGDEQIVLERVAAEFMSGEYVGYRISKAAVASAAGAYGYSDGEYDVRFAFVPYGGDGSYDYAITFTEGKEDAEVITSEGLYKTGLVNGEEGYTFEFIPDKSGVWQITSVCEDDTYGYLYTDNGGLLCEDDDGAGDCQFLLEYDLVAGTTYLVKVRYYSYGVGRFAVNFRYVAPSEYGESY